MKLRLQGQPVVQVWGTGTPHREFLSVDDLADASVHVMKHYSDEMPLNVGARADISMREFAELNLISCQFARANTWRTSC